MMTREQLTNLLDWVEARIDLEAARAADATLNWRADNERFAREAMWKALTGKGEYDR
jgi:hypothetical protein